MRTTKCALVTGVQTCALPIWEAVIPPPASGRGLGGGLARHARCCATAKLEAPRIRSGVAPTPNPSRLREGECFWIGQLRSLPHRHPGLDPGSRCLGPGADSKRKRDPGSSPG